MFAISREISREFSPSFLSKIPGYVHPMKFAPKELLAISQEISREFSPKLSNPIRRVDSYGRPASQPLLTVRPVNNRQPALDLAGNRSGPVSEIKLAPEELLAISQEISRAFSPRFTSKMAESVSQIRFAAKELFEISQEITREFAGGMVMDSPELMLLPVDPYHLHAYWHLDEAKANADVKHDSEDSLTLRIYAQAVESTDSVEPETWFDVAIDGFQGQQTMSLPIALAETVYSAAIGKCYADNSFAIFAYSNIISLPRGRTEAYGTVSRAQALSTSKNASGQGK
jgi:hypothetical protein